MGKVAAARGLDASKMAPEQTITEVHRLVH
jgi:hypothetical protein